MSADGLPSNHNREKLVEKFWDYTLHDGSSVVEILESIEDYAEYRAKLTELLGTVLATASEFSKFKGFAGWNPRVDGNALYRTYDTILKSPESVEFINLFDRRKDEATEPSEPAAEPPAEDPAPVEDPAPAEAPAEARTDEFEEAMPFVSGSALSKRSVTTSKSSVEKPTKPTKSPKSSKDDDAEKESSKAKWFKVASVEGAESGDVSRLKNEIQQEFTRLSTYKWTEKPFNTDTKTAEKVYSGVNWETDKDSVSIAFTDPEWKWEEGKCICKVQAKKSGTSCYRSPLKVCSIGMKSQKSKQESEGKILDLFKQLRDEMAKSNPASSEDGIYLSSELRTEGGDILAPQKPDFDEHMFKILVASAITRLILNPLSTLTGKREFAEFILGNSWLIASHPLVSAKISNLWRETAVACDSCTDPEYIELRDSLKLNELDWPTVLKSSQWFNAIVMGVPIKSIEKTRIRDLIARSYKLFRGVLRPISFLFGPFCASFKFVEKPNIAKKSLSIVKKQRLVVEGLAKSFELANFVDWFGRIDETVDCENPECGEYFTTW